MKVGTPGGSWSAREDVLPKDATVYREIEAWQLLLSKREKYLIPEYADAPDRGDSEVFVKKYPDLFEVDTPDEMKEAAERIIGRNKPAKDGVELTL